MVRISRTLGYEVITNWKTFNYLGVPIHKGKKKMSDWRGLVEKTKKKNPIVGSKLAQSHREADTHQRCSGSSIPSLHLLDGISSKINNSGHQKRDKTISLARWEIQRHQEIPSYQMGTGMQTKKQWRSRY